MLKRELSVLELRSTSTVASIVLLDKDAYLLMLQAVDKLVNRLNGNGALWMCRYAAV